MPQVAFNKFARRLLDWFARHGRHHLPWQQAPSPYRIWVSEIMLQQTQVATVIPYFEHFMERFPTVAVLAEAPLDSVLNTWTGLGYYARARNLHRASQYVLRHYQGELPPDLERLMALPGIGRSTAGAILALAWNLPYPILDGNVKRVLCRYYALPGWPGERATEQRLWRLAERHTPRHRAAEYTQAIMDLGATLCIRSKPRCPACPFHHDCLGRHQGNPEQFPAPRPKKVLPVRHSLFLIVSRGNGGEVLLQRRPEQGVWGGLWGFPECREREEILPWCREHLGVNIHDWEEWPDLRHTFSHFHLDITPVHIALDRGVGEAPPLEKAFGGDKFWYDTRQPADCGLAAPVLKLLGQAEGKISQYPLK